MPLRSAGGGAWESAGGYFLALTSVIQAGDAFKLISRETDGGAGEAFILDTEVSVTQPLLKLYNNTNLRLTVEASGNLIPGAGTTWGGFDLGNQGTTLGLYRGNASALYMKADYLIFQANAAGGYIQFFANSVEYMRMTTGALGLGQDAAKTGFLVLGKGTAGGGEAGKIEFKDEGNVSGYLWKDTQHNPRFHTANPGNNDQVGAAIRLNIFGMLFTSNGAGTQTLTVVHTNYKITQLDSAFAAQGGMTLDAVNNEIVVPVDGLYRMSFHATFTGGLAGIYKLLIVKNGAGLNATTVRTQVLNNGDIASVAMSCFQEASAGHDLELFVSCDQAGAVFNVKELNFTVDLLQRT